MNKITYRVHGLDCAEEVAILKRALRPLVSSEDDLSFEVLNARLHIANPTVDDAQLRAAIDATGMKAVPWEEHVRTEVTPKRLDLRTILCAVSGIAFFIGFAWHASQQGFYHALAAGESTEYQVPYVTLAAYIIAIISGIVLVVPKSWNALRALRPDMNLLMTIAVVGAVALGNWQEAALVSFLFSVALLLESWSIGRARRAITSLMNLAPDTATVLKTCSCSGALEEQSLPVAAVPIGACVLVKPGERIPLDGRVTTGDTTVNQAPITGESMPVTKSLGDDVFAGSINNEGAFQFIVTRDAEHSSLARILHLIEEAQARRAPSEQWVEKFARYYTPLMVLAAIAVAVATPLLLGVPWSEGVYRALVLLLIACPCALVISTPVSIVAGLATAARAGVLIKGGAFLEAPALLRAIALDKTGTLTRGVPTLVDIVPLNGCDRGQILQLAASLEAHSAHPIAQAILTAATAEGITPTPAETHQAAHGRGAEGMVNGNTYWIGNRRMRDEKLGSASPASKEVTAFEDSGHTVVTIGREKEILGLLAIADAPREISAAAIIAMKAAGIQHVAMLTGDNEGTARDLAAKVGVDSYAAELLPEDKVTHVGSLKQRFGKVAMIGDGVNDAPALAAADLSIAMGAAGSDTALETADIALMSDDLMKVAWLIHHSRRTRRIIQQNIAFSLGLKVAVLLLAFAGFATLWLAILADMGASLLVIANALRLLRE